MSRRSIPVKNESGTTIGYAVIEKAEAGVSVIEEAGAFLSARATITITDPKALEKVTAGATDHISVSLGYGDIAQDKGALVMDLFGVLEAGDWQMADDSSFIEEVASGLWRQGWRWVPRSLRSHLASAAPVVVSHSRDSSISGEMDSVTKDALLWDVEFGSQ